MSRNKHDCVNIYAFRTRSKQGNSFVLSKRCTYCCVQKAGFTIKHWKCTGPDSDECKWYYKAKKVK